MRYMLPGLAFSTSWLADIDADSDPLESESPFLHLKC